MRYRCVGIIFLLCFIGINTAEEKWVIEQNVPPVDYLLSIHFTDTTHGWAVGKSGTILMYEGTEWREQENPFSGTMISLNSVHFLDKTHGWIVGDSGTILMYDGTEWKIQNNPVSETPVQLSSVYFIDSNHGWAVGSNSTILRFDGEQWIQQACSVDCDFRSLSFVDTAHGWAAAYPRFIYKYDGRDWTLQYTDSLSVASHFASLCVTDTMHGWVVGRGISNNCMKYDGNVWTPCTICSKFVERGAYGHRSVFFTDPAHGWIVTFWASESGKWASFISRYMNDSLNEQYRVDKGHLYNIFFLDSLHGWGVGGRDVNEGYIVRYIKDDTTPVQGKNACKKAQEFRTGFAHYSDNFFPNHASITFTIDHPGQITLKVYSIFGKQIATLVRGYRDTGKHKVSFNTIKIPSGTYFISLSTGEKNITRRILIMK